MQHLQLKNNFIWLTLSLVGMMIVGALSDYIPDNLTLQLVEFSTIGLLFLSLLSLKTQRRFIKWFLVLLGLMAIAAFGTGFTEEDYFDYTYLFLVLLFLLIAGWLVAGEVLFSADVDLNRIVGSVALYMIIGKIFAIIYVIILEVLPTAFKGFEAGPWYDNLPIMNYFSFVTLTTLGYGDISPVTPMARVVVTIEAITGMFYLAVIVASLVGAIQRQRGEH